VIALVANKLQHLVSLQQLINLHMFKTVHFIETRCVFSNVFCISNVFTAAFCQRLLKNMMMMMMFSIVSLLAVKREFLYAVCI